MAQSSKPYQDWDVSVLIAFLTTFLTIVVLSTRLITGNGSIESAGLEKGSRPPMLPYWFPFIGHLSNFLYDPEALLNQARNVFPSGIFALKLGKYRHNVVYSPGLIQNLLSQLKSNKDTQDMRSTVMINVFGMDSKYAGTYFQIKPNLARAISPHLEFTSGTNERFDDLLKRLQGNLPDLVTFNPSMVDQEPWERLGFVTPSEDGNEAEASLLPLTQIFLTQMTLDTLFTPSILSDSDRMDFAPLLLALTQSHALLLTGLPRTLPHPSLPTAHLTRKRLLNHIDALHDILTDEEIQGPLLADRQVILEKNEIPPQVQDADLLSLIWGVTNPLLLAFWMLVHIISDQTLHVHILNEITPYVQAIQEAPVLGFTVPPRVNIEVASLISNCGLLKAAYIETVRLYSRGLVTLKSAADFSIEESTSKVFGKKEKWGIKKGEYVSVPFWLANTDPATFTRPEEWDADRHLDTDEEGNDIGLQGNVLDNCGSFGLPAAKEMCERTCLAFVAGVLVLYEFEPKDKTGWKIPKAEFAAGVALPKGDFRVKIKRSELRAK
ncbi:cytochrome P450 [Tothia fuscella]|uniref:Cytochrome P450 n=1 Tax=Tothia fuscella TaxID=1048955 RepID=A0A9P4TSC7_9PEZI|nr:cytochrome P450 [Tothia fuscella]